MARVTIEDCIPFVDDRFELVAVAAQRAKDIASGAPLTIDRKGEKDTVVALREIAEDTLEIDVLREGLVKSYQRKREMEEVVDTSAGQALIDEALSGDEMLAAADDVEAGVLPEEAGVEESFGDEGVALSDEADEEEEIQKIAEGSMEGISFAEDNLDVDD